MNTADVMVARVAEGEDEGDVVDESVEIRERAQEIMAEREAGRVRSLTDEENRRLIEEVLGPLVERNFAIGTWNMDHWKRTLQQRNEAWNYLKSNSNADVMLLQESVAPSGIPRNRYVYREIAGRRPWGSSVVAFADDLETEEIGRRAHTLRRHEVQHAGKPSGFRGCRPNSRA